MLPCCLAPSEKPFGSLHDSTLEDVWHGDQMRELRANMLAGTTSQACTYCYNVEGSGGQSPRQNFNRIFEARIPQMKAEGANPPLRLLYIDFRFSNLCNFKCRTCGPQASSAWVEDWQALTQEKHTIKAALPAGKSWTEILTPHLDTVEEIYFAGGEPLFMKEHYWLVAEIAKRKRNLVRLRYNTNFTYLKHTYGDAVDLWKHFDDVYIGASLDGSGARGEYIRKGLRWEQVLANRERLRTEVPHVSFKVASVVGLMNLYALPDMHREMIEKSFIRPSELQLHILDAPAAMSAQVLPHAMKLDAAKYIEQHIDWLKTFIDGDPAVVNVIEAFRSVITHMLAADKSALLPDFQYFTKKMDELRSESFTATFPEFEGLV